MKSSATNSNIISLEEYGITHTNFHYQEEPEQLQKATIENNMGVETSNGTLAVNTGEFTGRSPMDRFIVKDDIKKDKVW